MRCRGAEASPRHPPQHIRSTHVASGWRSSGPSQRVGRTSRRRIVPSWPAAAHVIITHVITAAAHVITHVITRRSPCHHPPQPRSVIDTPRRGVGMAAAWPVTARRTNVPSSRQRAVVAICVARQQDRPMDHYHPKDPKDPKDRLPLDRPSIAHHARESHRRARAPRDCVAHALLSSSSSAARSTTRGRIRTTLRAARTAATAATPRRPRRPRPRPRRGKSKTKAWNEVRGARCGRKRGRALRAGQR